MTEMSRSDPEDFLALVGRSHQPWWRQALSRTFTARMVPDAADFDLQVVAREDEDSGT